MIYGKMSAQTDTQKTVPAVRIIHRDVRLTITSGLLSDRIYVKTVLMMLSQVNFAERIV